MAVINLRGVPDELAAQLKSEAALGVVGFHEYCLAILRQRGHFGLTVARMLDGEGNVVSQKKIADISMGGGATEGGGTPCLPPLGKAQDGALVETIVGIDMSLGQEPVIHTEMLAQQKSAAARFTPDTEIGMTTRELGEMGQKIFGAVVRRPEIKITVDSIGWIQKVVDAGGLPRCSAELLDELREEAKTNKEIAIMLCAGKIELDREILIRWGLAENYKPKTEEADGVEPGAAEGKDKRGHGGNAEAVAGDHGGDQEPAVGVGKPGVDMEALRAICAGNITKTSDEVIAFHEKLISDLESLDPHEVDLCGFKSYNEEDGENYVCGKEVHGPKVKHGEWIKV